MCVGGTQQWIKWKDMTSTRTGSAWEKNVLSGGQLQGQSK